MARYILVILVILVMLASTVLVACTNGTTSSSRPEISRNEQAEFQVGTYTLYRINGDRYPGMPVPENAKLLHGWEILESCTMSSTYDRALLFKAFEEGQEEMRGNDQPQVDCFQPRHGIRTVVDGLTTDYLICFECLNFMVWENGEQTGGGVTTRSPAKTFDALLAECGSEGDPQPNPE